MANDLILLGLFFGIAGTFLWAKSIMFKKRSQLLDEASSFYGHNTPKVKGDLIQQYETGIGVLFIGIGFIIQVVSIYTQIYFPNTLSVFSNEALRVASLLVVFLILIFFGAKISYRIGFDNFLFTCKESLLNAYNIYTFIIKHNGVDETHFNKGSVLTDEYKAENLKSAREHLLIISKWLDIKRKNSESDESLFNRLGDCLQAK